MSLFAGRQTLTPGKLSHWQSWGPYCLGDLRFEKRTIRGVESEGMICSEKELGMAEESAGIMVLADGTPLGRPLEEITGAPDSILNLEITTNRPDCLSHWA